MMQYATKQILYSLAFLLTVWLVFSAPAYAEALDDASIRKLYADTVKVRDPAGIQLLMEDRLDSHFTLQQTSTTIMDANPAKETSGNYNKAQSIDFAVEGAKAMNVDSIDNKVTDIKYSADHKFAYVTDTTAMTGIIHIPVPDGNVATRHFEDGSSCIDLLTLNATLLKIMQSACNDRIVLKK